MPNKLNTIERRYTEQAAARVQVEDRDESPPEIVGYAAVYYDGTRDTEYQLWTGAVERIMPGAFDRALADRDDARGLFNHDPNQLLGRLSADTLSLASDKTGLKYRIQPGETTVATDVIEHIRRGDLQGSSFAFSVTKGDWVTEELESGHAIDVRVIEEVKLYDVGPVTFPAYDATTTGLRVAGDCDNARATHMLWKQQQAHQKHAVEVTARAREVQEQTRDLTSG